MKRLLISAGIVLMLCACPSRNEPAPDTAGTTATATTVSSATPPTIAADAPPAQSPQRPHYRFWTVDRLTGPPQLNTNVTLTGTLLGTWTPRVTNPEYLGNPAAKTHGGTQTGYETTDPHYVMYVLTSDREPPAPVIVNDQFTQGATWTLKQEYRLLVPADKKLGTNELADPPDADHFVCFGVSEPVAVEASFTLRDQFQESVVPDDSQGPIRLTPKYYCGAVTKRHGPSEFIAKRPNDRLAIYQLSRPARANALTVRTKDQFTEYRFRVREGDLLAVPQDPNSN